MFKRALACAVVALAAAACGETPTSLVGPDLAADAPSMGQRGPQIVTDTYIVPGTAVFEGFATGFVLMDGLPVTVTASGSVQWYCDGTCGDASPDGVVISAPGRLDDGSPPISLLATIGEGGYEFVGSGPTELTGAGELVFYVNDSDSYNNGGSWTVEVSYECYPGNGNGDTNHYHCGPPGKN
jgi:hypothetical protein